MIGLRMRRNVARIATMLAAAGVIAVAAPTAAHAACVPTLDVTGYPAWFDSATLNTTTGEIVYLWGADGAGANSGCVGTMSVYLRLTDRSIAPAGPIVTSGWVNTINNYNGDGSWSSYWGLPIEMSVTYRDNWTALMRGTMGQITAETKVVFTPSSGPATSLCKAYTKTITSTPTGPQVLSETPDTCLP